MGGISVIVMLGMMGTIALVVLGVVALAAAAFIAATVVSIVFACRTKRRREQGKKLKGLIAIPIALYALSIPILIWFAVVCVIPLSEAETTSDFVDCTQAVTRHDPDALEDALAIASPSFDADEGETYQELLAVALDYKDAACAAVILDYAEAAGNPVDLDEPFMQYTTGDKLYRQPALVYAAGREYGSAALLDALLDHGADPNATGAAPADGQTALHLVCAGSARNGVLDFGDTDGMLDETDRAIDTLLDAGADPTLADAQGMTPFDRYRIWIESLVENNDLTAEEASALVASHERPLGAPTA